MFKVEIEIVPPFIPFQSFPGITCEFHWLHVRCRMDTQRFSSVVHQPHQLRFECSMLQYCWTAGVVRERSSHDYYRITCHRRSMYVL